MRAWFGLASASAAILATAAFAGLLRQHWPFTTLVFISCAATLAATFVSVASSALAVATADPTKRAQVSGFKQAGITCGVAIGGGLSLILAQAQPAILLYSTPLFVGIPCITALAILRPFEGKDENISSGFQDSVKALIVGRAFRRYGLLLALPLSVAAASALFRVIARNYGVSESLFGWTQSLGSVVFTSTGSIIGSRYFGKTTPVKAYVAGGIFIGALSSLIVILPTVPATFVAGVVTYLFFTGICNAGFANVALTAASENPRVAGTAFSALAAINNLSSNVVTAIEGQSIRFGFRAVFVVDAIISWMAVFALSMIVSNTQKRGPELPTVAAG
jgi:hypothetical protein